MSERPDESGFERYLEGCSELSRAYRELGGDDPPASLDEVVIGRARDAIVPGHARRRARRLLPLAAAAMLMLSFGLVLRVVTAPPTPPAVPHADNTGQGLPDAATPSPPRLPADARRDKARALEAGARAKTAAETNGNATECTRPGGGSQTTPEQQLELIVCLRAAGAEEAARRELASFRAAFPDHPLPEPLRDP